MLWKTLSLASVLTLGLVLISHSRAESAMPAAKIGQPAPQFSLTDQSGKTINLSDYTGKIVVLEWFNNECPIVQRHYKAGTMNTLAAKYAPDNVVWLAINSTHDKTDADNFAAAKSMSINRPILNDAKGATGHAYGATNTPHMFIIDKAGVLQYEGAIDDDQPMGGNTNVKNYVSQALDEILAGKPVSQPETKAYGCAVHYAQ